MGNLDRPVLNTAKEQTDRNILTIVVACFLIAVVVGFGFSYLSSRNADQMAVVSGSSTDPEGPNTPADLANKRPVAETTGSNTNVPPATSPR